MITGEKWLKNSISIWSDIKKDKTDHPASFPLELVHRLLDCYGQKARRVLDPFAGSGTVLLACAERDIYSVGFEIYEEYIKLARERLGLLKDKALLIHDSVENMEHYLNDLFDLVITSPPYWNVLKRKRTADRKESRFYGHDSRDFGNIENYEDYLQRLISVFIRLKNYLSGYLLLNVMDLREKGKFYPLHADLICGLKEHYKLEDIIIWDRRKDYNNLKPLGYPYKFIVNKVHEFILIFSHGV